jgi:hypothetical protein
MSSALFLHISSYAFSQYAHTHTYIHTYYYTHIHTHTYIYIYIHSHTHTHLHTGFSKHFVADLCRYVSIQMYNTGTWVKRQGDISDELLILQVRSVQCAVCSV